MKTMKPEEKRNRELAAKEILKMRLLLKRLRAKHRKKRPPSSTVTSLLLLAFILSLTACATAPPDSKRVYCYPPYKSGLTVCEES